MHEPPHLVRLEILALALDDVPIQREIADVLAGVAEPAVVAAAFNA